MNGLWPEFRYCVFDHNLLAQLGAKNGLAWRVLIFPLAFPFIIYLAARIIRDSSRPPIAARRGFVFLVCAIYLITLRSFWRWLTRQDYLPFDPLAFIFLAAGLFWVEDKFHGLRAARTPPLAALPVVLAVAECVLLLLTRPFWHDRTREETELLSDVLALTNPGDYVFDRKGETIFRQRCFRPVLEPLTLERIGRGVIPDNMAQCCINTSTCVVAIHITSSMEAGTRTGKIPSAALAFFKQNYVKISDGLQVAGMMLKPSSSDRPYAEFEVTIPTFYKIVERDGVVSGLLDGAQYDGARFLGAGKHRFIPSAAGGPLVLFWAQAADRGFSPFSARHL